MLWSVCTAPLISWLTRYRALIRNKATGTTTTNASVVSAIVEEASDWYGLVAGD
jgi:hypothetical protein